VAGGVAQEQRAAGEEAGGDGGGTRPGSRAALFSRAADRERLRAELQAAGGGEAGQAREENENEMELLASPGPEEAAGAPGGAAEGDAGEAVGEEWAESSEGLLDLDSSSQDARFEASPRPPHPPAPPASRPRPG
jgi:hypothetical protein